MDYLIRAKQIDILATGIIDAMGLKFFEQAREDRANSEWTARQQRKAQKGLDALDKLAKTADETGFLAGGQPTVTHFSVVSVLDKYDMVEMPRKETHPKLAQHHTKVTERKSFQQTKP